MPYSLISKQAAFSLAAVVLFIKDQYFGACFMCGPCLESHIAEQRTAGKRDTLFTFLPPVCQTVILDTSGLVCRITALSQMLLLFLLVIDGLDFLKKENAGARDSIRYLEAEFKKGNR